LVSALKITVDTPVNIGGQLKINWQSEANDPNTWTFELHNVAKFRNDFALVNNVDPAVSTLTLPLPSVPVADGYTVIAVDIGNITNIIASSQDFSIGAGTASGSSSSSSTAASASSTSSSRSSSGTASTSSRSSSTSAFGTTITAPLTTGTNPASSGTGGSSSSGTGTQSAASNTTSTAGALGLRVASQGNVGAGLAVALSLIAGAALVAL